VFFKRRMYISVLYQCEEESGGWGAELSEVKPRSGSELYRFAVYIVLEMS
jgi:hypothetical protein